MPETTKGKTAPRDAKRKQLRNKAALPTPEATPEVEAERVNADSHGKGTDHTRGQDAKNEIDRLLKCGKDSHADILAVEPSSSQDERLASWRRLGCAVHPNYCKEKGSRAAFDKLAKAATQMGVEQQFIDEVNLWDGETDLQVEDSDSEKEEEDDNHMDEDEIPMPPARVASLYATATGLLHQLGEHPDDSTLLGELKVINDNIKKGNEAHNGNTPNESDHVPVDQWLIPATFFGPHYNIVLKEYAKLQANPEDEAARANIWLEKDLFDDVIERHHFPKEWTVLGADEYLAAVRAKSSSGEPTTDPAATGAHIEYPWPTGRAADGSKIIGIRRKGRGHQVCVETVKKEGRVIRSLESASDVGLLEVEAYKTLDGHKDLAAGQSRWSRRDAKDFRVVHWATEARRKNPAAFKMNPAADCCVEFHSRGIQILTVSSLTKVLGPSARVHIERVCRRDGIAPPWEAGATGYHEEPAQATQHVNKDSSRRRNLNEKPDAATGETDQRIKSLETTVTGLAKTMDLLASMFQEFMKTSSAPKQETSN